MVAKAVGTGRLSVHRPGYPEHRSVLCSPGSPLGLDWQTCVYIGLTRHRFQRRRAHAAVLHRRDSGQCLAPLLHLPFLMLAGIGFVAVFTGPPNTPCPWSCSDPRSPHSPRLPVSPAIWSRAVPGSITPSAWVTASIATSTAKTGCRGKDGWRAVLSVRQLWGASSRP